MSNIFKYITSIVIFILALCMYLIYTTSGQNHLYHYMSKYISYKTHTDISIKSINIVNYPYIKLSALLKNRYTVLVKGNLEETNLNLTYQLLEDDQSYTAIDGTIKGSFEHFNILGSGLLVLGDINYNANIKENRLHSLKLLLKQSPVKRLAKRLGYETDIDTIGDIVVSIETNGSFYSSFKSPKIKYTTNNGHYEYRTKSLNTFYNIDIFDLGVLDLSKNKTLSMLGEIEISDKIQVSGLTKSFGGFVDFNYIDSDLDIYIKDASLSEISTKLWSTNTLDGETTGSIKYNTINHHSNINLKFTNSKIVHDKINSSIKNIIFEDGSANLIYKNNILSGYIGFNNDDSHMKLEKISFNRIKKRLSSDINLKLLQRELKAKLTLKDGVHKLIGSIDNNYHINIDVKDTNGTFDVTGMLTSKRLPSHICTIVDDVNVKVKAHGMYDDMSINIEAKALEGNITMSAKKGKDTLRDIDISIKDVHSLKLNTLLGYPISPNGLVDISMQFKHFNMINKEGHIVYNLKNGRYKKTPLSVKTDIVVKDNHIEFNSSIDTKNTHIDIKKGNYNLDKHLGTAFYIFDSKLLQELKDITKTEFYGSLYAMGNISYNNGIKIEGLSKTFDGITDFTYQNNKLMVSLNSVSLKRFMSLFPYTKILDAKTTGNIKYDFIKNNISVKTRLKKIKFLHTKLVNTIYEKAKVNMLSEIFTDGILTLNYQDDKLNGYLKVINKKSHFFLTDTKIDYSKESISALFDFSMKEYAYSGTIYGKLYKPEVKLNIRKLVEHEMDKQVDSFIGKGNREMMEGMPMGGTAKDVATETATSFMKVFF